MAYTLDLSGRVALITGASGGLGEQFAKTLAKAGAAVVLASRRTDRLMALRAHIEAEGGDAHVVALDMKTGKELWKTKFGEWKESYGGIVQPMIANGVLISGMAGGDRTARGFIDGYDPDTGKQLWRRWTVPAPGEPGSETWPNATQPDAWKYGGGATWQAGSYDAELDLYYVGTGNAQPYNPKYRDGMDSLCTTCILALRPKTGEVVWYYQTTPGDNWDYTATQHIILADLRLGGKARKVLMQAPKNGFFYVLDRATGAFLSARNFVPVTWAKGIDPHSGRPIENA